MDEKFKQVKPLIFICPMCGGGKLLKKYSGVSVINELSFHCRPTRENIEIDEELLDIVDHDLSTCVYSCFGCDYNLKEGNIFLQTDEEVIKWIEKNCPQD